LASAAVAAEGGSAAVAAVGGSAAVECPSLERL